MSIRLGHILLWIIGIIWALAGVAKIVDAFSEASAPSEPSWVSTFPSELIFVLAIVECGVALLVFANRRWAAMIIGSLLLSSFTIALSIWPMKYEQPCGCLGEIALLDEIDPISKIIFFAGLHIFAAALIWNGRIKTASYDAVVS